MGDMNRDQLRAALIRAKLELGAVEFRCAAAGMVESSTDLNHIAKMLDEVMGDVRDNFPEPQPNDDR